MRKNTFLLLIVLFLSSVPCFAQSYGFIDLNIRGTIRRVYFFQTISAFESATGQQIGSLLNWVQLDSRSSLIPQHTRSIFNIMIRDGYVMAFYAHDPWHDPNHGRTMYEYTFFLIRHGTWYTFMPYLSSPINFPRR